jgi:translocation and assembly module TamB
VGGSTVGGPGLKLEARLPDLGALAELAGEQVQGSAVLTGSLTRQGATSRVSLTGRADVTGSPPDWSWLLGSDTGLQVLATSADRTLEVQRLSVTGQAGSLEASGSAERPPPGTSGSSLQALHAKARLDLRDLAALSPLLAGQLSAAARIDGPVRSLSGQLDASSSLSVRGSPPGSLQVSVRARGLPSVPSATIKAQGTLDGAPLKLEALLERVAGGSFRVAIPYADWKSAHAHGEISAAKLMRARGRMVMQIDRLEDLQRLLGTSLAGRIAGSAALGTVGDQNQVQVQLEASDVNVAGIHAAGRLTAAGPLQALPLTVALQLSNLHGGPASLDASAQLFVPRRELALQAARIVYRGEPFQLLTPSRVSFAHGVSVSHLKVGARQAVLELHGGLLPALDVRASLQHVDAALINTFVPDLLAFGSLGAQAQLHGPLDNPVGRATVKIAALRLAHASAAGPAPQAQLTAVLPGDGAARLDATLADGASQLTLHGLAPLHTHAMLDLALSGRLDLALVSTLLLEASGRRAAGVLEIQARVTGTPADPEIDGGMQLTQGELRDYNQGVRLTDITGRIVGRHRMLEIESMTAKAVTGDVNVTGTIDMLEPGMPVDLNLTARHAQPIVSDILTANLDADVKVTGSLTQEGTVSGTIHVNRAEVGVPSGMPQDVAVIDVRRRGEAPPPARRRVMVSLDLLLDAPRQILIKGRGLDAELGGSVRFSGTSEAPAVSGGFEVIRGSFSLANALFKFTAGRVTFNGEGLKKGLDPSLDFTAEASVPGITAIVRITGLADSPQFELSSIPELPQDEILARMLFSRSTASLSAGQLVQVGAAFATLTGMGGSGGGLNPLGTVQKRLGLDRLTVAGTGDNDETDAGLQTNGVIVEAGRYVSPNVFVSARGSTTGGTQLQVDVGVGRRLKLRSRVGNGSPNTQGANPEDDPGNSVGLSYELEVH